MNDRFTRLADAVSEGMGYWWVSALALIAVLAWLAAGPMMGFSDTWQLAINTPTTIAELFIGFLLAAAANRAERRNRDLMEQIKRLVEKEESEIEKMESDAR